MKDFDTWWHEDGRMIDPDFSDVPWFDKRESLCESAWNAAREPLLAEVTELKEEVYRRDCDIEGLNDEGDVLLTAIAEIAGQKLCHEMELPDDGDYRFAYEEMIRVARLASDAVKTPASGSQEQPL